MINYISVSGFRSLREFELEIKRGVNVLVGPNGAGKTNIILFFEFLRYVYTSGASDAVGRMGGVGSVFQKRGRSRFSERISFSVRGSVSSDEGQFAYEVGGTIRSMAASQELVFERQRIRLVAESGEPYLDLVWEGQRGDEPASGIKVLAYPPSNPKSRIYLSMDEMVRIGGAPWLQEMTLLRFLQHAIPAVDPVLYDLSSRSLLNVVPSVVKGLEDSSRSPGIDSTGAGLSATLFAIRRKRPIPDVSTSSLRSRSLQKQASWARVMSQVRVAVPSIEDIEIENDPFDNRLRVKVLVGKGARRSVLPLSALSDGTVKWMSLVVRLATSRAALLLEEPENYLHPLMQQEVVRMLRDSVADEGFVILSTHSETLLNAVRAEELVVVSYRDGATRACRVSNAEELNEEISKTGFGLGYYYLADAVRD